MNETKFLRRQFLQFAVGAAALPAFLRDADAQSYPSRPITMIVPFPAGGPTDVVGRVVAELMRGSLGQPIIVENIGGADGSIGVGRTARARPDGYTIDVGALGSHVLNGAFYSLSYDLLNDFVPISPLATNPYVLFAKKNMQARDLNELIAWLKANPNRASVGTGSASYRLLAAFFQKQTGTQLTLVPYRGLAPAMLDLIAGEIDLSFGTPDQLPLARAQNLKVYAATSEAPLALAPDIPTFRGLGLPTLSFSDWWGLFAPKGTPRDIIGKLNAAAVAALSDPAVRSRIVELGFDVFPREQQTPNALGALQKAEAEKWWPIIRELGIKAE